MLAASTVLLGKLPPLGAIPTLLVKDLTGGGVVVITDNGVGDPTPTLGVVQFSGTLGTWTVATTGTTKLALGTATVPTLVNTAVASS